jgi:hypothetical protein
MILNYVANVVIKHDYICGPLIAESIEGEAHRQKQNGESADRNNLIQTLHRKLRTSRERKRFRPPARP